MASYLLVDVMTIVWLMLFHFVGDFLLQSTWMSNNKSKRWAALSAHVSVYSIVLLVFGLIFGSIEGACVFAVINGALHFLTDAITSRITAVAFRKEKFHWFFVTIGADQYVHFVCLYLTMGLLS